MNGGSVRDGKGQDAIRSGCAIHCQCKLILKGKNTSPSRLKTCVEGKGTLILKTILMELDGIKIADRGMVLNAQRGRVSEGRAIVSDWTGAGQAQEEFLSMRLADANSDASHVHTL